MDSMDLSPGPTPIFLQPTKPYTQSTYAEIKLRNRSDYLKLILYDLNSAIAPRKVRLKALHVVLEEFNHEEKEKHCQELDLRADHILFQKLTYVLSINEGRNDSEGGRMSEGNNKWSMWSEEVGYICAALEMVYRAKKRRVTESFHEIAEGILPVFVGMIRAPFPARDWNGGNGGNVGNVGSSTKVEEVDFDNGNSGNQFRDNDMSTVGINNTQKEVQNRTVPFYRVESVTPESVPSLGKEIPSGCAEDDGPAEEEKDAFMDLEQDDAEEELASALAAASLEEGAVIKCKNTRGATPQIPQGEVPNPSQFLPIVPVLPAVPSQVTAPVSNNMQYVHQPQAIMYMQVNNYQSVPPAQSAQSAQSQPPQPPPPPPQEQTTQSQSVQSPANSRGFRNSAPIFSYKSIIQKQEKQEYSASEAADFFGSFVAPGGGCGDGGDGDFSIGSHPSVASSSVSSGSSDSSKSSKSSDSSASSNRFHQFAALDDDSTRRGDAGTEEVKDQGDDFNEFALVRGAVGAAVAVGAAGAVSAVGAPSGSGAIGAENNNIHLDDEASRSSHASPLSQPSQPSRSSQSSRDLAPAYPAYAAYAPVYFPPGANSIHSSPPISPSASLLGAGNEVHRSVLSAGGESHMSHMSHNAYLPPSLVPMVPNPNAGEEIVVERVEREPSPFPNGIENVANDYNIDTNDDIDQHSRASQLSQASGSVGSGRSGASGGSGQEAVERPPQAPQPPSPFPNVPLLEQTPGPNEDNDQRSPASQASGRSHLPADDQSHQSHQSHRSNQTEGLLQNPIAPNAEEENTERDLNEDQQSQSTRGSPASPASQAPGSVSQASQASRSSGPSHQGEAKVNEEGTDGEEEEVLHIRGGGDDDQTAYTTHSFYTATDNVSLGASKFCPQSYYNEESKEPYSHQMYYWDQSQNYQNLQNPQSYQHYQHPHTYQNPQNYQHYPNYPNYPNYNQSNVNNAPNAQAGPTGVTGTYGANAIASHYSPGAIVGIPTFGAFQSVTENSDNTLRSSATTKTGMDISTRTAKTAISDLGASMVSRSESVTASMRQSYKSTGIDGIIVEDVISEESSEDSDERVEEEEKVETVPSQDDFDLLQGIRAQTSGPSRPSGRGRRTQPTRPTPPSRPTPVTKDDLFQFQESDISETKEATSKVCWHTDNSNNGDNEFQQQYEDVTCPLAIRNVLKILRYFSRVFSAMVPMANEPGLVDALLYQLSKTSIDNGPTTGGANNDESDEANDYRVDAMATLVNLACAEENKMMLAYYPGLLEIVIHVANHSTNSAVREHASITLMNLAYAEENKVHMVHQDHLLDTLVNLLSDESPFTRRYASAALFTLACTFATTAIMAKHLNGGILEALRRVLLNDPVDEARVNAAEALFNMAKNNANGTVENMGNHPKLLSSLAYSVVTDYSADVRAYSSRALEWLAADIHHPMPCHQRLLQALTTASGWTKTTCIASALKMQASLSINRRPMVEHEGLLDALSTMALLDGIDDEDVRSCAIFALERLTQEQWTRHIMVRHEGVMTALTKASFGNGVEDEGDDDMTHVTSTTLLTKNALKNLVDHL